MAGGDRVNDTAKDTTINTNTALGSDLNKKLVHQIRLEDFNDENNQEVCEFGMRIESINDQRLFDGEEASQFMMERRPESDGKSSLINVYLSTTSVFDSAMVSLSCATKKILHRTELHFLQDNI